MKKYRKFIVYCVVIAVSLGLFYFSLLRNAPELYAALKSGNAEDVTSFLQSTGTVGGMICLGLLQFMQEISIFMSAAVIQFAAGLEYGFLRGWLVCEIGYVAANVLIFVLVRKFSGLTELIGESNGKKIKKAVDFINQFEPIVSIVLLCLIPIVPNGIVPYAASQMNIKLRDFTFAVSVGCAYPMIVMLLCGQSFLEKDYLVIALVLISNLILCAAVWLLRNKLSDLIRKLRNRNNKTENTESDNDESAA